MANLSGLRHFLRDTVGLSQKEAASYTRAVRASGLNNAEQETELVNHLSSKYKAALNGGTHDDVNISREVYNALGAKNARGEGLGGKIWNAGQSPQIMNDSDVWDTTMKAMEGKTIGDLQKTYERFSKQKPILRNDSDVWDAALEASEGGTIGDLESNYRRLAGAKEASVYNPNNTPSTPAGGFKLPNKHLNDFRPASAAPKSSTPIQDIFTGARQNALDAEIGAANPLGTQASREAEIAEAKARMAEQGAVTGSRKDGKGFFNSVKSSVANMKAKYNQATEALYDIAGKNHTPTEFQQQTTAMVGKFSGGKWTGGVNTEKMNWLEANAHENLYSSVGRDYDNLIAKMQGAKTQEDFSKLMEDHHIKYSEGMSGAELNKNINAHFNERIDGGPGVGNYIVGNKAASGAMLGVSGASVLALSDSRGSRSNSQLYSSQI
jgi:hypothetical protein